MINVKNGSLYQWDINRVIEIDDSENTVSEVHCCREEDTESLVLPFERKGDIIEAVIPNVFLQTAERIYVYAVSNVNDEVKTSEFKAFRVNERQKPADYVYEESEVLAYKKLENEIRTLAKNKADLDGEGKIRVDQLPDIIIKEESDGGVQADYEQNDSEKTDYIRNRPFYEVAQKSHYLQLENPTPVSFVLQATNHVFHKVSDIVVYDNRQIFNGQLNIMVGNANSMDDVTPAESDILIKNNDFILTLGSYGFLFAWMSGKSNFNYMGQTLTLDIPEAGIYNVLNGTDTPVPKGRIVDIKLTEEIKKIDVRFLPVDQIVDAVISKMEENSSQAG